MPIRDADESEHQADSDLLEFIDRRRDHQARERRRRLLLAVVAALALISLALVFSNVVLMRRLAGRPDAPPDTSVPTPAAAVTPAEPVPTPPAATAPTASVPAPSAAASAPEASPPAAPRPAASVPPAPPAATARRPTGTGVLESTTPSPPPTPRSTAAAADDDPAQRTARWLVQTHGRAEAENRVTKVTEFYSGEQGAFWRRVLRNVRQEPER
jgi:hypothetical protein